MYSADTSITIEHGTSILGEGYTDIEVRSAVGVLEARLKDGVLQISYAEGNGFVFQLGQIQTALGPGAFAIVKGYATDQMAANIKKPGYVERLARAIGGRLGGAWSHAIVREGVKRWIVFMRQAS